MGPSGSDTPLPQAPIEPSTISSSEWQRVLPFIRRPLALIDTHAEADIWNGIQGKTFQLWPGEQSALITEVIFYPLRRDFRLFLAGGDLAELLAMEPVACAWAKQTWGCRTSSIGGRDGWIRTLSTRGYRHEGSFVRRDL